MSTIIPRRRLSQSIVDQTQVERTRVYSAVPAKPAMATQARECTEALHKPVDVGDKLKALNIDFMNAEKRGRDLIDECVVACVRLADELLLMSTSDQILLPDFVKKRQKQIEKDHCEMLRIVFQKAHSDQKRASFYFRATRKLFSEYTQPDEYKFKIDEAGGYQKLANANRQSNPRKKQREPLKFSDRHDIKADAAKSHVYLPAALDFRFDMRRITNKLETISMPTRRYIGFKLRRDLDGRVTFVAFDLRVGP